MSQHGSSGWTAAPPPPPPWGRWPAPPRRPLRVSPPPPPPPPRSFPFAATPRRRLSSNHPAGSPSSSSPRHRPGPRPLPSATSAGSQPSRVACRDPLVARGSPWRWRKSCLPLPKPSAAGRVPQGRGQGLCGPGLPPHPRRHVHLGPPASGCTRTLPPRAPRALRSLSLPLAQRPRSSDRPTGRATARLARSPSRPEAPASPPQPPRGQGLCTAGIPGASLHLQGHPAAPGLGAHCMIQKHSPGQ